MPIAPRVSDAQVATIQQAWVDTKLAQWAAQRPRVLRSDELAFAIASVESDDAERIRAVYEARLGAPIFFVDGRLTRAGSRAWKLYDEAWTHGQPRPPNWPQLPTHAAVEAAFSPPDEVELPLAAPDVSRVAAGDLVPFPVERLIPGALRELIELDAQAKARRRDLAAWDALLVSAMWQLARATRPEDRRPKARQGPWQPDTSLWRHPETALDAVVPTGIEYERLRKAYVRYVGLRDAGGFPTLPAKLPHLELGDRHDAVPALRSRLAAEGFVAVGDGDRPADVVDDRLVNQLMAFQASRLLKANGQLDSKTLDALRVGIETLVDRLQFGLHRWQLSSGRDLDYYLRVNIPQFQVQVFRDGDLTHRFKAVVGKGRTQTPRFQGVVDHLLIHPWWFGVRGAPKHVAPGPKNPLGILVLRIQPHHLLIYLHGTNQPHLFSEDVRAFSHGCVRMFDPTILGGLVLDWDPGPETAGDLPAILDNGRKTTRLYLAQPVPVFFEYNTTYVSDDGVVYFARDMYRDDAYLRKLLDPPHDPAASWARERSAELADADRSD